jgi:hypothetical protein
VSQRQITECLAESIYADRATSGKAIVAPLTRKEEPGLPTDSTTVKAGSILDQR